VKGTGHYIMSDGSIQIKNVELSGDYVAVVVMGGESDAAVIDTAMQHLANVAHAKANGKKPIIGRHDVQCPQCHEKHVIAHHLVNKNSRFVLSCGCGYQLRISSTPVLKFFGPKLHVS
jgi:ribosomal protein S27AE